MRDAGIAFAITSGRPPRGMQMLIEPLKLTAPIAWENSGPTYRMSEVLASRGIAHHLDDWGPKGGHEWPYWHHQMWEYVGAHY